MRNLHWSTSRVLIGFKSVTSTFRVSLALRSRLERKRHRFALGLVESLRLGRGSTRRGLVQGLESLGVSNPEVAQKVQGKRFVSLGSF